MKTLIAIPARYGSKRFPGKPLAVLEGKTILERVWEIASYVVQNTSDCNAVVATEEPSENCPSRKIIDFCQARDIPVVVTSSKCRSGTERAWAVASMERERPDIVVNLQGDAPTCPPEFISQLIKTLSENPNDQAATIYTRLSWEALDAMREAKKVSPFSGTTVIRTTNGTAAWFSKNIIPAIRDEDKLRASQELSPVLRHVGLYAYRWRALDFFVKAEPSYYETLEQLEQLRFLENGLSIRLVEGKYPQGYDKATSGVDSPEDLARIAQIIRENGELIN